MELISNIREEFHEVSGGVLTAFFVEHLKCFSFIRFKMETRTRNFQGCQMIVRESNGISRKKWLEMDPTESLAVFLKKESFQRNSRKNCRSKSMLRVIITNILKKAGKILVKLLQAFWKKKTRKLRQIF